MDTFTPEKRSQIMARIRSGDTQPEMVVRRLLHRAGFRFRLHVRKLPGKPDIVLPRFRVAIAVNGCFWHAHECQRGRRPKSNTDYWFGKIEGNVRRDAANRAALESIGWKPIVVWACETRNQSAVLERLCHVLAERAAEIPTFG